MDRGKAKCRAREQGLQKVSQIAEEFKTPPSVKASIRNRGAIYLPSEPPPEAEHEATEDAQCPDGDATPGKT
jgi:hypothetical protein